MHHTSVHLCQHPIVSHKLTILRDKNTGHKEFRELVREVGNYLGWQALSGTELQNIGTVQSEFGSFEGQRIKTRVALVPILRAGLGLVDGLLDIVPFAPVLHLGLFREKITLQPVEYYSKLPQECNADECLLLDPMIATAGTAIAAINMLKDWGVKKIKLVAICASKAGIEAVLKAHPDVHIYVTAIDNDLNDKGYICPGLGDAGDRLFNTAQ